MAKAVCGTWSWEIYAKRLHLNCHKNIDLFFATTRMSFYIINVKGTKILSGDHHF